MEYADCIWDIDPGDRNKSVLLSFSDFDIPLSYKCKYVTVKLVNPVYVSVHHELSNVNFTSSCSRFLGILKKLACVTSETKPTGGLVSSVTQAIQIWICFWLCLEQLFHFLGLKKDKEW